MLVVCVLPHRPASFPVMSAAASSRPDLIASGDALQLSAACLADREHALIRRFGASKFDLQHTVGVWGREVIGLARDAACDCAAAAFQLGKAAEGAAEEARVRAAQLAAYALLLERDTDGEEEVRVSTVARALLNHHDHDWQAAACPAVVVEWNTRALPRTVNEVVRIRDGVDPLQCTVCGDGITRYRVG